MLPITRTSAVATRQFKGSVVIGLFSLFAFILLAQMKQSPYLNEFSIFLSSANLNSSSTSSLEQITTLRYDVPYISNEEFNATYAITYNGHLPRPRTNSTPDPSCGTNPDFIEFFKLPPKERSRLNEDKMIYSRFFKNTTHPTNRTQPKGTYIELGAFNGEDESNTMFFDKCLGWDGLLIEGQPGSYAKVIEHRPHAVRLSFSPSCKEGNQTVPFYNYPFSNNGMEGYAKSYEGKPTIDVPCGPLTPVLMDVFGPDRHISFLSLDVEGAELLVLETLDLSKIWIDVVMIEVQNNFCHSGKCPAVFKVRDLMDSYGYILIKDWVHASDVFVRRNVTNGM